MRIVRRDLARWRERVEGGGGVVADDDVVL